MKHIMRKTNLKTDNEKDEFENRDKAGDSRDELENDNEEKDGFGNGDERDELENGGEMNLTTDMKTQMDLKMEI